MREKIRELAQEIGISEIEKILEDFKQEGSYLDNYQSAKEWFNNIVKGVSIHKQKGKPDSLCFMNDIGEYVMIQDFKTDVFYVGYRIWEVFESEFGLEDEEIEFIIQSKVEKEFRIKISKPVKQLRFRTQNSLKNK